MANERGPKDGVDREILFAREMVARRVRELGEKISEDYRGKNPVFVGILKGSFIFFG
jgi:hypoxanthine-guanine phosphoribosyltransferase